VVLTLRVVQILVACHKNNHADWKNCNPWEKIGKSHSASHKNKKSI